MDDVDTVAVAGIASCCEALARGAWDEARAGFEQVLVEARSPEAYEGLAMAAWWQDDVSTTFEARRQAFHGYRAAGDRRGAARVATALAWDHLLAGDQAVCRGWRQRAGRLVDGLDPCSEHGGLAVLDAHLALIVDHDAPAAERASRVAVSLGHELAEIGLEMLGSAYQGLALVTQGQIGDGMRLLDESTAAALSGEITDPDAAATCCCTLIYACERVYDYPRAAEWCQRLKEVAARWSYQLMLSVCRTHYAGVLMWRGLWADAEAELLTAMAAMEATRPGEAAEAVVRLAQLRCRQGRFDDASALFARTESDPLLTQGGTLALCGRAEMALERGDPRAAAELAERYLRAVAAGSTLERSGGLALIAHARSLTGDLEPAAVAVAELSSLAAAIRTEPVRAAACDAAGVLAVAQGDHDAARRWFEDATDHYQRSGGVYETARARLRLAEALTTRGRDEEAATEAQEAYRVLRRLGALHAAAEAADLLRGLSGALSRTVDVTGAHLTPRELEILRLLAQGLSNQRMAEELVLSVRTVERHVGNIYDKLGVSGSTARAAATAYALTHGVTSA